MKSFLKLEPSPSGYQPLDLSPNAALSNAEAQLRTPDGAYTTFRTYDKYFVLNLSQHFDRIEETAALTGKSVRLNRPALRSEICAALEGTPSPEARIRLSLDLSVNPGDIYLSIEPFAPRPANLYQSGVETATVCMSRTNPRAKLSRFLGQADAVRRSEKKNVEEYLMISDDREILEGLSSNFYAILRGELFTADEGVLAGTTRKFILDLAAAGNVPVRLRPISVFELNRVDEAFLSSTSRSILPVRKIDRWTIGNGAVGPITAKLMKAFDAEIRKNLSDLRIAE